MGILDRLSMLIRSEGKALKEQSSAQLDELILFFQNLFDDPTSINRSFQDFIQSIESFFAEQKSSSSTSTGKSNSTKFKSQEEFFKEAEQELNRNLRQESLHWPPEIMRHFSVLEIEATDDHNQIRHAWKTMMKKYHPDLYNQNPEKREAAAKLSARLTQSYQEILGYLEQKK